MRKISKLSFIFIIVAVVGAFASCGAPVEGEDLILSAREKYAALDSAKVVIVNDKTGETEQTFIYKYDEKDVMTYSYTGTYDGKNYAEFNNSLEMIIQDGDELKTINKGEKDFIYYNRKSPHPNASEGLLLFSKKAIKTATVEELADGSKIVKHIYDVEELNNAETSEGEIVEFDATYTFNKDGEFQKLVQKSKMKKDGQENDFEYSVTISMQNEIEKVENPVIIEN